MQVGITKSEGHKARAVVFDAVGTLIHPDPPVASAYARAAERQGVLVDPYQVQSRFRRAFTQAFESGRPDSCATSESMERARWRRIVHDCLPEAPDQQRAFRELWDHFANPASWRVYPEVPDVLDALGDVGLRVRVGSNFDGRLRPILRGIPALQALADYSLISSEIGWRKPHEAFYLAVRANLGLPAESILFVGDDLENDYRAPRQFQMQAVSLDRSEGGTAARSGVRSLSELLPRLG